MKKKILYVDLDGVLADYESAKKHNRRGRKQKFFRKPSTD